MLLRKARPDHGGPPVIASALQAEAHGALWLPIFDQLADSIIVARIAAETETTGWDGVFVWDHIRWREPVLRVADA